MSIRTYFENIALAIKEKNPNVVTVTPSQMPDAILNIPSGGGDVVLMTRAEWNALTTAEKQTYGLVAIEDNETGYDRGVLVDGSEFRIVDWAKIKQIIIKGRNRSAIGGGYTQLGDMRFSDGTNYLGTNKNNISSSTTLYGSFVTGGYQGNTQFLFDNDASTKTISSGSGSEGVFQWTTIFTNAVDLSQYTILELWTANDSSERDPFYDVEIDFTDTENVTSRLIIGNTNMTTLRQALGYSNNDYQSEVTI